MVDAPKGNPPMARLQYLTVQDMLWINLAATKKVQHFNYAKLEEATFYQYSYGESTSLLPQAARFLTGFLRLHPFDAGNEATGLIGCASFLSINGQTLDVPDEEAVEWLDRVMTRQVTGADAIQSAAKADPEFHETLKADVRSTVGRVLSRFPVTIEALATQAAK